MLYLGDANNIAAIEQAALALSNGLCNYVLIPSGGAGFNAGSRARNATADVGGGTCSSTARSKSIWERSRLRCTNTRSSIPTL